MDQTWEQYGDLFKDSIPTNVFRVPNDSRELNIFDSNRIIRSLGSSLDISKTLTTFLLAAKKWLPINGINLQSSTECFEVGRVRLNPDNSVTKTISVSEGHPHIKLEYFLTANLSVRQQKLMAELHLLAKQHVRNAFEHHQVKRLATLDYLTGLSNRSAFDSTLDKLLCRMERSKNSEFGLLAIDLDNFKQVNDTLGHQSGDKVLIEVAEILSRSIRGHDYAFRLGGDEFACVLTNINQDCNHIVANRIQTSISESAFLQRVNVSGSIGSTFAQTQDDQQSIYERADRALYSAKAAGRNCIVAA